MQFHTGDGRPVPAVTAEEMRAVDRAAEAAGMGLLQMMENAGRNLAAVVRERAPAGEVVVLAGNGGNGGGGLCAARHLANHGRRVALVLDRDPDALDGAAATQFSILRGMDDVSRLADANVESRLADAALVVDALVGYSLRGALRGRAATLAAAANEHAGIVCSLDVPSGRDATTGDRPGVAVEPDCTVTLALPKTGLDALGGDLVLADIAIPAVIFRRAGIAYDSPFDGRYRLALRPPA